MNALNSIILEGNLVRDPELRKTEKGTAFCQFSIAVNRWFKQPDGQMGQEVSFFDVIAWGNQAQSVVERARKGRGLRVVGRLFTHAFCGRTLIEDRWIDTNGKQCSKVVISAEHVEIRSETKSTDTAPQNSEDSGEDLTIGDTDAETPAVNW